jgi:hypothetical protein
MEDPAAGSAIFIEFFMEEGVLYVQILYKSDADSEQVVLREGSKREDGALTSGDFALFVGG